MYVCMYIRSVCTYACTTYIIHLRMYTIWYAAIGVLLMIIKCLLLKCLLLQ